MSKPLIKETKKVRVTIEYDSKFLRWIIGKARITIESIDE